jgi:hypothetical protein
VHETDEAGAAGGPGLVTLGRIRRSAQILE